MNFNLNFFFRLVLKHFVYCCISQKISYFTQNYFKFPLNNHWFQLLNVKNVLFCSVLNHCQLSIFELWTADQTQSAEEKVRDGM